MVSRLIFLLALCCLYTPFMGVSQVNQSADQLLESLERRTYVGDSSERFVSNYLVDHYRSLNDTCSLFRAISMKSYSMLNTADYDSVMMLMVEAEKLFAQSHCDSQSYYLLQCFKSTFHNVTGDKKKAGEIANKGILAFQTDWPDKYILVKLYIASSKTKSNLKLIIEQLDTALAICHAYDVQTFIPPILLEMGAVYANNGDFETSEDYFIQVLPYLKKENNLKELAAVFNNLAGISNTREDMLSYIDSAIYHAQKANDLVHLQMYVENKAYFYSINGDFEDGYDELYFALELQDSVLNVQKIEAVADVQEKYESEKKANEIRKLQVEKLETEVETLNYQRNQNTLLLSGLSLLLIAMVLAYGFVNIRKNRNVLAEKNIQIAEAHEVSEGLLHNILPEEVAAELKTMGQAEAKLIENVTVLFTDFKGFTAMAEVLTPKELVNDLNICFSEFDRIMDKYGIEKIKTIGDAYMAAGGLPVPNDTHAKDAVLAAFEMRDFVEAGKQKKIEAGLPYFEIRIGIHTGPVVAGIVGVKKFQYDIWGDTVNTASRMESSGEVGKVNISQATYQILTDTEQPALSLSKGSRSGSDEFVFESRGKIEAKGKGEMEMYFVSLTQSTQYG